MWCPEEEKNEKEKREEKSMPALFMEINRQYGMRCMQRIRKSVSSGDRCRLL